eukprot:jgi/Ulvmu1/12686/UM094_0044.1
MDNLGCCVTAFRLFWTSALSPVGNRRLYSCDKSGNYSMYILDQAVLRVSSFSAVCECSLGSTQLTGTYKHWRELHGMHKHARRHNATLACRTLRLSRAPEVCTLTD